MSELDAVRIDKLGHDYGASVALHEVDLSLEKGEIMALLGPNGGGKSTLFRILATLLAPTRGSASVLGHDVVRRASRVREVIGVVFQAPSLDGKLTVRENLMYQGHLHGLRGRRLARRIEELLAIFGISNRTGHAAETLSGGLARRVDLAKSLLHDPSVLLLDEPSSGLDPAARHDLFSALARNRDDRGTTVFLTTHLTDEAAKCDRVGILDRGRLVSVGKPSELVQKIGAEVVTLAAEEASKLARELEARFGGSAFAENGVVRMEREGAAALLPRILESYPGRVSSATVSRPTLEDVFFRATGRTFHAAEKLEEKEA
jgi:ABC-2 type transport system ATP-binding protein